MSGESMLNLLNKINVFFRDILNTIRNIFVINRKFRIGFSIIAFLIFFSIFSLYILLPLFEKEDIKSWHSFPKDRAPSPSSIGMLLGTTTNGRSVFWILTRAILNSFAIGFVTALVASHIGLFIGILAGLKGGLAERILVFIIDSFIVIPGLPLLIVLSMSLREYLNVVLIGLIISVIAWTWPARQVRALVLSLREKEHVVLARFSGMKLGRIIVSEIFPYIVSWHFANMVNTVLFAIATEAGLAVLGLSKLEEDTLGTMIYWANNYSALFRGLWWWISSPIITLILLFIGLYLVAVGIGEYANPRLRIRQVV